jgi:hypothetical protein
MEDMELVDAAFSTLKDFEGAEPPKKCRWIADMEELI